MVSVSADRLYLLNSFRLTIKADFKENTLLTWEQKL